MAKSVVDREFCRGLPKVEVVFLERSALKLKVY
jgi:hypothetical protein